MKVRSPIDYGNVPITKLPPGKALGADDLTKWAHRRAIGSSGTGTAETQALTLECKGCGAVTEIMAVKRITKKRRGTFVCYQCGDKKAHVVKIKDLKAR